MKRYKAGLATVITVALMAAALFPIEVQASLKTVSGSDVEVTSGRDMDVVSSGDAADEMTATIDVSDMVYQAGGWGTPVEVSTIALYALDEQEQLKEEILEALQEEAEWLDISSYNLTLDDYTDLKEVFAEVLNEHPELFYVYASLGYRYSGDRILRLNFYYGSFTSEEKQAFADKLEQAVEGIRQDMTDVEKAMVLHDYLAQHCSYAYSEYLAGTLGECENVYNAYGALVEGKSVCQGYALAYSALLRTVGIQSDLCSSSAMNHAWNVIVIDGEWYHVDVTWDDPVWNKEGRAKHTYFLVSDSEMMDREHHDWSTTVVCTSTKYDAEDYWWNAVESQIVMGDNYYYVEEYHDRSGSTFRLVERTGDAVTSKYVSYEDWDTWNGSGFWIGSYSYLSKQGDYLYFNDKLNLYAMKPTDPTPQIVYTYEGGDGYIYGAMVYEDGTARLNIDTTPNSNSDAFITVDLGAEKPKLTVDYDKGTISTTQKMEYSVDGGKTWKKCTANMNLTAFGWNGNKNVEVSFRTAEAGGKFAGDATTVTLKALPGVVGGTVTCFGNENDGTTLQLLDGKGAIIASTTLTGKSGEYTMQDVSKGSYTLQVSRPNHTTRKYMITVDGVAVMQPVELHLMGDVNGDGRINAVDKKMIYNHIVATAPLEGYDLEVADVNGDASVNARDKKVIYNHIAGISRLW